MSLALLLSDVKTACPKAYAPYEPTLDSGLGINAALGEVFTVLAEEVHDASVAYTRALDSGKSPARASFRLLTLATLLGRVGQAGGLA